MKTVDFLIKKTSDAEIIILCQDGGIAFIEHNDTCFMTICHSMRLPKKADNEILINIIENDRKTEIKDWQESRQEICLDMILDAIYWLFCGVDAYIPRLTYYECENIDMYEWLNENYREQ